MKAYCAKKELKVYHTTELQKLTPKTVLAFPHPSEGAKKPYQGYSLQKATKLTRHVHRELSMMKFKMPGYRVEGRFRATQRAARG